MGKSKAIWTAILVVVFVVVGFLLLRWLRGEDIEKKLKAHYRKLGEVLAHWQEIRIARGPSAESVDIYLNMWTLLTQNKQWSSWLLEHLHSGYPGFWETVSRLRLVQDQHNKLVPLFTKTAESETIGLMKSFGELHPYDHKTTNDYYISENVTRSLVEIETDIAVQEVKVKPTGFRDWITMPNAMELRIHNGVIARSDQKVISRLKEQINKIRENQRIAFIKLRSGLSEMEELVEDIRRQSSEVAFQIENSKQLKGECQYERSLNS